MGRTAVRGRRVWISGQLKSQEQQQSSCNFDPRFGVRELALTSWKKRPNWQILRHLEIMKKDVTGSNI